MEILWTEPAEAHLRAIYDFHARVSVPYAERLAIRIAARTEQLADFPHLGPVLPGAENLAIRVLVESDYRILYVVGPVQIVVLGVLHGSRGSL